MWGEYTHSLTAEENGPHFHTYDGHRSGGSKHRSGTGANSGWGLSTSKSGEGKPHNNVQPSQVVNIWRRVS